MGQTPLHLCIDWLLGLKILLEAGANPNLTDNENDYPIDYAVTIGKAAAVHLLGKYDTELYQQHHDGRGYRSLLEEAISIEAYPVSRNANLVDRENTTDAVIALLATRRRSLQRLLNCSLPVFVINSLDLSEEKLLDGRAPYYLSALEHHSALAPDSLKLHSIFNAKSGESIMGSWISRRRHL